MTETNRLYQAASQTFPCFDSALQTESQLIVRQATASALRGLLHTENDKEKIASKLTSRLNDLFLPTSVLYMGPRKNILSVDNIGNVGKNCEISHLESYADLENVTNQFNLVYSNLELFEEGFSRSMVQGRINALGKFVGPFGSLCFAHWSKSPDLTEVFQRRGFLHVRDDRDSVYGFDKESEKIVKLDKLNWNEIWVHMENLGLKGRHFCHPNNYWHAILGYNGEEK